MDAFDLLRWELETLHGYLEATLGDVTAEQAHRSLGGHASPIAANYAHVVIDEDVLSSIANGSQPLVQGEWADRTGISEIPPVMGDWEAWGTRVTVDLAQAREYAQAVYVKTMSILASMSQEDLGRMVDLSAIGLGQQTAGVALGLVACHGFSHAGEISHNKGIQGLKGYPI